MSGSLVVVAVVVEGVIFPLTSNTLAENSEASQVKQVHPISNITPHNGRRG